MSILKSFKKKQKNKWKRYAGILHLWLGLCSGLIVFVIAITGCIFVFHDEIKDVVYDWRFVPEQNRPFVKPSIIINNLQDIYPGITADMVVYNTPNRPATVHIFLNEIPHDVYFNPYSGDLIHTQNLNKDFFMIVETLHRFLLLPEEIGKQVTGIATIIFLFMLISGIVLWWPKKWNKVSHNLTVKWSARWRRKNYDWHRASGFYMILPAMFLAITGLAFSYEWVNNSFYTLGNLNSHVEAFNEPKAFPDVFESEPEAIDMAFFTTIAKLPNSEMYFVWDQGQGLPIITGAYPKALAFDHQSNFYFHPQTGHLLTTQFYNAKSGGVQLQEMTYGLHTGQYLGVFGKIMAFIGSLFIASLPVTGFIIWYGRRKKNS